MSQFETEVEDLERRILDYEQETVLLEKIVAVAKYRRRSYMIGVLEAYHKAVEEKAELARQMAKLVAAEVQKKIDTAEALHV